MSKEDKEFLEKVMKEGIIDENERMKEILKRVTEGLDDIQAAGQEQREEGLQQQDEMEDLLQELRDIVEQIDYARAFMAMKGLTFLLGAVTQKEVPKQIQMSCLGVLATMAQHNPPIQKELLEMGAIKTLSEVFQDTPEEDSAYRARVMQAVSAAVRSHELAEGVFCGVEQSRHLILEGLHGKEGLQKRTLFLLRALITSDTATRERVRLFAHSIAYVADQFVLSKCSPEIREMAVALLEQILEQKKSVNTVLDRKNALVAEGVKRVAALRALTGKEKDFTSIEIEHWEGLLMQLSRATPDGPEEPSSSAPAVLEASKPETTPQ